MTRLFIGIAISEMVQRPLAGLQAQLKPYQLPVRWSVPEKMHITLHFLGETEHAKIPVLAGVLHSVLSSTSAFELSLGHVGAFPNMLRPVVLWVGLAAEVDQLLALQSDVVTPLVSLGFVGEARVYHPHLTIGRVDVAASGLQRQQIGKALFECAPLPSQRWQVTQVALFQSTLRADGAHYTQLDCVDLITRRLL